MNKKKLLKVCLFTPGTKGRWGLPIILRGKPGTGKSAEIETEARRSGLAIETIIASIREPSDFLGLPIPETVGKNGKTGSGEIVTNYAAPLWARRLGLAERGLCLLDEINTAPPAVQAALLRLVLEGAVGDRMLPPTVRFIGAMNAVAESAGGWDLPMPLANRFGHFDWESPSASDWNDWLLGQGDALSGGVEAELDPAAEEARVLAAWAGPWARARGLIAGFVRARPEFLMRPPEAGSPAASSAWPSPRSMEMAARALAGGEVHGLLDGESVELAGCFVGPGCAAELEVFRISADLPDPEALLDEKLAFKHEARRLDRTAAVLASCAALVSPPTAKDRNRRAGVLWRLIGEVTDAGGADLTVPAARVLAVQKLYAAGGKDADKALQKLAPLLQAAGIQPQQA